MSVYSLEEVLHPESIAVVGASDSGRGPSFLTSLIDFGFKGKLYPVNPKYSEISSLQAYPSVKDIPGTVDYVISAAPAPQVPKILEDCAQKGVKGIHLFTARFSETGREDAIELEKQILAIAKAGDIRIIGPNCMGVYYPEQGLSFQTNFPKESGPVGLASQSGQAAGEIISATTQRGLFFNKAVSYGNAIDFNECDFLEYYAQDPEITLIMMYIEGVKDGSRFFDILRKVTTTKPVVVIKGGRGQSGSRATSSHTASLAGSMETWNTMISQAGAVSASSIDELVDMAVSFYLLPPITGRRVGIFAGGGGATVLAADQCEEAGLDVIALPQEIRDELRSSGIQIWDWIGNPIDFSINMGDSDFSPTQLLRMMAMNPNFDLIIAMIGGHPGGGGPPGRGGPPHGNRPTSSGGPPWMNQQTGTSAFLRQYKEINDYKPVLGLIPDRSPTVDTSDLDEQRWKSVCEMTAQITELKIPHYPTISRAARAVSKLIDYYQKKERSTRLNATTPKLG
jgi:acyl-CoA synthetase (NDP forming)